MEQPIKSKQSEFLDRWSRTEVVNSKLGVALMVMTVTLLCLTAALIFEIVKPKPVYFIPGANTAGVAYAQTNSKSMVAIFAASWVLSWTNFTPANVDDSYKRAGRFMSPRLLNRTKSRLKRDVEQVKNNNISSLFSINQDPVVKDDQRGFHVVIQGDKGIYMGKEEIKLQKVSYYLRLKVCPPTDFNPYGFIIDDISQETGNE